MAECSMFMYFQPFSHLDWSDLDWASVPVHFHVTLQIRNRTLTLLSIIFRIMTQFNLVSHKSTCQKLCLYLSAVKVKLNRFDVQLNCVIVNVNQNERLNWRLHVKIWFIYYYNKNREKKTSNLFSRRFGRYTMSDVQCPVFGSICEKRTVNGRWEMKLKWIPLPMIANAFNWKRSHNLSYTKNTTSCYGIRKNRRNMTWNEFHDEKIGRMLRNVSISLLCT